jgi:hypothetical protein
LFPTIPTSLPPSGAASGDLSGTYPSPNVDKVHGIDMQSGTPTADDLWIYGGAPAKWQHGKIKTINSTTLIGSGNITTGSVTSVAALTLGTSGTDLSSSVANGTTAPVITLDVPTASAVNRGALSAADFTTFNAKQSAITLTTTGSSGAATLTGATLNIPQYSSGGASNYKSTTDSASFLSVTNTPVYTQLITANTFAAGDIIRINFRTRKTGVVGVQALRMYVNATANLSGTPILVSAWQSAGAANLLNQMQRHWVIKNATTNTETLNAAYTGYSTDYGVMQGVLANTINWTLNRYIVFAIQNSNATDVNFGSMYLIEKL